MDAGDAIEAALKASTKALIHALLAKSIWIIV